MRRAVTAIARRRHRHGEEIGTIAREVGVAPWTLALCLVIVTRANRRRERVDLVRQPLPIEAREAILYRCPTCKRSCRYLYLLRSTEMGLEDAFPVQCHRCAGLRWASQGRYRSRGERAVWNRIADIVCGGPVRNPLPRTPWDPRAVSDPRVILNEFPELRAIDPGGRPFRSIGPGVGFPAGVRPRREPRDLTVDGLRATLTEREREAAEAVRREFDRLLRTTRGTLDLLG